MATLFNIDYEAGTLAAAVGAESGYDTISGTNVYDNTIAADGTKCVKCTGLGIMRKNVSTISAARIRWYYRVPVITPGINQTIAIFRSSTTARCGVRLQTSGNNLRLLNVNAVTGSGSNTLIANEEIRLEWAVDGPGGTQSLYIFRGANKHGLTPDETLTGTYTNASWDNMAAGCLTVADATFVSYADAVKATDTPATMIGPTVHALSGTAAVVSAASGTMTNLLQLSGTAAATSAASGSVTALLSLAGTAAAVSSASGDMTARLSLAGTAAVVSGASGSPTLLAALDGSAQVISGASGAFGLLAQLGGQADVVSGASGAIEVIPGVTIPLEYSPERGGLVTASTRGGTVSSTTRGGYVPPDERGN